jgi:hypothetical protein
MRHPLPSFSESSNSTWLRLISQVLLFTVMSVPRFKFDHLFAFTVDGLIPCLLSSLCVDMVHRVFVEGFDVTAYIGKLLGSAPVVARHTAIIHVRRSSNTILGTRYTWANADLRPWGNTLPQQCPKCHAFKPWSKKKQGLGAVANCFTFRCKGKKYDTVKRAMVDCTELLVFNPPLNYQKIADSDWIAFQWP